MILRQLTEYDPTEFQPIRYEGELVNKGEFVVYKTDQLLHAVGHVAHAGLAFGIEAGRVIVEHIGMEV